MVAAKLVLGGAPINSAFGPDEQHKEFLAIAKEYGVDTIDTAFVYGDSEKSLGRLGAAAQFIINTKHPGGMGPNASDSKAEAVVSVGKQSLSNLKTKQVDVYFIHAPDRRLPFEETLEGVNQLYKSGAFRRFGLSNFLPAEVEEVVRICSEKSYVAPTVYQGSYCAVQRTMEDSLLPVLRRHGLAYHAYGASGGGFLAKTPEHLRAGGDAGGRWDGSNAVGQLYRALYADRETTMAALEAWQVVARDEGVTGAELAFRWVVHHSVLDGERGDAVIVGARGVDQLRSTLAAVAKGPLSEGAAKRIGEIWDGVRGDSFLDGFNADQEKWVGVSAQVRHMDGEFVKGYKKE